MHCVAALTQENKRLKEEIEDLKTMISENLRKGDT
jgi:hypothetical protein